MALVLVIDDDPWTRNVIADALMREGFAVEQAADSCAALRMVTGSTADIILVDLGLPDHAGLEVLQAVRDRHPYRELPMSIVGAYAMVVLREGICRAGSPVNVPFDLRALLAHVRDLARGQPYVDLSGCSVLERPASKKR